MAQLTQQELQQISNDLSIVCDFAFKAGGIQANQPVNRLIQLFQKLGTPEAKKEEKKDAAVEKKDGAVEKK